MLLAYKAFNKATTMVTRNAFIVVGMEALFVGFGVFLGVFVAAVLGFFVGALEGPCVGVGLGVCVEAIGDF